MVSGAFRFTGTPTGAGYRSQVALSPEEKVALFAECFLLLTEAFEIGDPLSISANGFA
jgi:hypothetical protein